ncbi:MULTISPECIES: hypothetical protein [unclassified Streptomyces]|uniref:hypothetical protein n=1 Tax=unclassified Streptomyces TaxID=2593676 RepID=UPI0019053FB6|nr:hypothetical protein [Streptomyces sp. HSG2]
MNATTPLRTTLDNAAPGDLHEDQPGRHTRQRSLVAASPLAVMSAGVAVYVVCGVAYATAAHTG